MALVFAVDDFVMWGTYQRMQSFIELVQFHHSLLFKYFFSLPDREQNL